MCVVVVVVFKFYYCISDIVIYLIYIDLMRKSCQLINVDVDVDVILLSAGRVVSS